MDEAGEKLKRAFTGAFALLFAVIVLCAVFCNQNVFGTQSPRSLLAGGLALAVGVLCAAWLLRLLPAPGKRLRRTLLAAFFTLCFLAQAHVGRALVVGATGDWDFGIVLRAALDFAADGAQGGIYFNNFPNNQPLMLLLAGLFRLLRVCGVTEEYELLVWGMRFGAVLLQLALFFLYLCAARLLGRRAGALALLLGAVTAPFLLYAPVYYTDTVTAPIPIAILYCWLRLRAARREGRPGRGPLAAVFVLGVLGTLLKVTVVIMVIAVVLDLIMSWFEGQMRKSRGGSKKMWIPVAAIVLAFILLLPYGRGGTGDILLYDGDYSETQLMHHMVKMLVEDQTDLTVTIQDQMSQVNNWNSLKDDSHTCDLMISYDGTILTTFLGQDTVDVPEGMTIYDYVQGELDSYGLTQLEQLGFENTYAIGVPQALADEYGLETISDLIPIADQLTFGAEQEFFTLEGSMKYDPFVKFYGLNFQDAVSVDMGLKYSAIENGSFDVAVVYSTDGLNKKVGLKVLEDDQSFFPDYNGVFLVRDDLLEKYPEVADILNQLAGKIPTEQMAELTYQVDVEGRTVDEVAREFLVSLGLLEA